MKREFEGSFLVDVNQIYFRNEYCFVVVFLIKRFENEFLIMMPGLFANRLEKINYLYVYLSAICKSYLILYILIHIK